MPEKRNGTLLGAYIALCALLVLFPACALGEPARELTQSCVFQTSDHKTLTCLSDGRYDTRWVSGKDSAARLEITLPEGETCGGVYILFSGEGAAFDVQTPGDGGKWETVASCQTDYLTGYAALSRACAGRLRIVPAGQSRRFRMAQIHVFAPGETPEWVQRWQPPCEKADLLVLAAHPDDEVLFMGGTLPTYAGERGLQVQVCNLVPSTQYRQLELLDCLWTCGVRHYPEFGSFGDVYKTSLSEMYRQSGWSRDAVYRYITKVIRKYKPEVVVTHDIDGEYGHGAHKVCADAMLKCIDRAADTRIEARQVKEYGVWQVKKLYLHLYPENVVDMDWRVPLGAFGGKTAFAIAQEGFLCHRSQLHAKYAVEDFGPYDNSLFGLAFSAVGADAEKNDFFENILPESLSSSAAF